MLERCPKKELKVAGHRLRLKDRVPHLLPPEMERWVDRSGLTSLQRTSLTKIDTDLVTQFVERWHIETSSFHMSFGEMTITLDDISCLLHLPIEGVLWYPDHVTEDMALELDIQYLGIDRGVVTRHIHECRGAYYSLQWLYDKFVEHRAASSWPFATRTCLMILLGCTIFADKTFTLVETRYVLLFRDLE
ncbi:protein MAIN-LIKE 1-like [Vicia villosa]|uniref:protein MAIN-LIKE 1-like n=1 Tax=Vicia villosa TaxID=3911 RepID=UPI00273B4980|nr:protein MAIN-LIKE 1-like [Vicia villosa]